MRVAMCFMALLLGGVVAAVAAPPPYALPDLPALFAAAQAEVGAPLRIYRLELGSDGDAELLVQRNDRRDLVDVFRLEDGKIEGPGPVKFDEYPSLAALDYHAINGSEVDLARLPAMIDAARAKAKMPVGRVLRIKLERGDSGGFISYNNVALWSIWLDDERHDADVQLDLRGKVIHVERL